MLINNIGEPVHKQVIDAGILPVLVKIVKKKVHIFNYIVFLSSLLIKDIKKISTPVLQSDLPVREKIFLLLDAAQTSVGGVSGRFPQYYSAYYELVVGTFAYCMIIMLNNY